MIEYSRLYLDGVWTEPSGSDVVEVISPHTEQVVGRTPYAQPADVDRAVAAARKAFEEGEWPRLPAADRGTIVARLAAAYQDRAEDMAQLITTEMGSPIAFSRMVQSAMPIGLFDPAAAPAAPAGA